MLHAIKHQLNHLTDSWRTIGRRRLLANLVRFTTDPEARHVDTGFDARFGTETNVELAPVESLLPPERPVGAAVSPCSRLSTIRESVAG